jgi:hypothetical protein
MGTPGLDFETWGYFRSASQVDRDVNSSDSRGMLRTNGAITQPCSH